MSETPDDTTDNEATPEVKEICRRYDGGRVRWCPTDSFLPISLNWERAIDLCGRHSGCAGRDEIDEDQCRDTDWKQE